MRILLSLLVPASLMACKSDFSVTGITESEGGAFDTGEALDEAEDGPVDDNDEDDEPSDDSHDLSDDEPTEEGPDEDPPEEDEPAPEDDCEDTSDLIYVIDRDDEALYLFDPEALELSRLGALDCSWYDGSPASMGVTRQGIAYVRYSSNAVFAVDLETLECDEVDYSGSSFGAFGMGFATNHASTWQDQLYVANRTDLARLDTNTWQLTTLGRLPSQAELTGTADGQLWAFLPLESPAALVELDKNDGTELSRTRLAGFPSPTDIDTFAFAAWGGAHYLFVRTYGMGETTDVYEVDSAGRMTQVMDRIGINVVGAGVSTCAPVE